jgi:SecD/SecF fusion protein
LSCSGQNENFNIEEEGGVSYVLKLDSPVSLKQEEYEKAVNQSIEVIEKRLNASGLSKKQIKPYKDKEGYIRVDVPSDIDQQRIIRLMTTRGQFDLYETYENKESYPYFKKLRKDTLQAKNADTLVFFNGLFELNTSTGKLSPGCIIGSARPSDTAQINQMLKKAISSGQFPSDMHFRWYYCAFDPSKTSAFKTKVALLCVIKAKNMAEPAFPGRLVTGTEVDKSMDVVVAFLGDEGMENLSKVTIRNQRRAIANVLDDRVTFAPILTTEEENTTGKFMAVAGKYTPQELEDLATIIGTGPTTARFTILSQKEVQKK